MQALISRIRERRLTYCGYPKLENLGWAIQEVQKRCVPGIFLEAGCALGGSAIFIANMKPEAVPFYIYDVFGVIPSPGEEDGPDVHARYEEIKSGRSRGIGTDPYYGYEKNLKETVIRNIREFGLDLKRDRIELIEGVFEKTLHPDQEVALAHIDCDWFESVNTCIQRIAPKMSAGGFFVFDDYDSYSGCKKAVDRFLSSAPIFRPVRHERSLLVEKTRNATQPYNCKDQFSPTWDLRARNAVALWSESRIPSAENRTRIGDLGCGSGRLKAVITDAIGSHSYQGYDKNPSDAGILEMDLDRQMPSECFDVVFCLGLLEYLKDPAAFLKALLPAAEEAVISYVVSDMNIYSPEDVRTNGWLSHFSSIEIEAILKNAGWAIRRRSWIEEARTMLWLLGRQAG